MLRLFLRADELAVGTLKVALDGVVLEVVDGLGFVLNVVVARRRRRSGGCRLVVRGESGGGRSGQGRHSEERETDDEWLLHDSVLLTTEARLLDVRQPKPPLVPYKTRPCRLSYVVGFTPKRATPLTLSAASRLLLAALLAALLAGRRLVARGLVLRRALGLAGRVTARSLDLVTARGGVGLVAGATASLLVRSSLVGGGLVGLLLLGGGLLGRLLLLHLLFHFLLLRLGLGLHRLRLGLHLRGLGERDVDFVDVLDPLLGLALQRVGGGAGRVAEELPVVLLRLLQRRLLPVLVLLVEETEVEVAGAL